ncbi:nicotinate-nucleotide--dimethylbenzimidazole phosphoribosyltransferase [Streptomyces sp. NPDC057838]|uniref:nicotinate-nucleotide--dimethylbenzimidazole phosphoribosyltransferase n=1 Tax=unclassified Streptomyces TaxID=2593676 RepID=UPI00367BFEB6
MTDTGQVPAEGLPENAGMVEQPGAAHGSYTYLSETPAEDEDLLLPGAQGAWGHEVAPPAPEPVVETVHEPGPHELSGRDSGSVDLGGVRLPDPPPIPPITPRRPLHLGPPLPDASASPVRSLADRGPADAPVRQPVPSPGPEYLDAPRAVETPSAPAAPWSAQPVPQPQPSAGAAPAETVVPAQEPVGAAQAVVARVAAEAGQTVPAQATEPTAAEATAVEPVAAEATAVEPVAAEATAVEPVAGEPVADELTSAESPAAEAVPAQAASPGPVVSAQVTEAQHAGVEHPVAEGQPAVAAQTAAAGAVVAGQGAEPGSPVPAQPVDAASPVSAQPVDAGSAVPARPAAEVEQMAPEQVAAAPTADAVAVAEQSAPAVSEPAVTAPDAAAASDSAGSAEAAPGAGPVAGSEQSAPAAVAPETVQPDAAGVAAEPAAVSAPGQEPGSVAAAGQGPEAGPAASPEAPAVDEPTPATAAEQSAPPAAAPEAGPAPEAVPFPDAAGASGQGDVTASDPMAGASVDGTQAAAAPGASDAVTTEAAVQAPGPAHPEGTDPAAQAPTQAPDAVAPVTAPEGAAEAVEAPEAPTPAATEPVAQDPAATAAPVDDSAAQPAAQPTEPADTEATAQPEMTVPHTVTPTPEAPAAPAATGEPAAPAPAEAPQPPAAQAQDQTEAPAPSQAEAPAPAQPQAPAPAQAEPSAPAQAEPSAPAQAEPLAPAQAEAPAPAPAQAPAPAEAQLQPEAPAQPQPEAAPRAHPEAPAQAHPQTEAPASTSPQPSHPAPAAQPQSAPAHAQAPQATPTPEPVPPASASAQAPAAGTPETPGTPAPPGTPAEDVTVVLPAPPAGEQSGRHVQGPQQSQPGQPGAAEPAALVPAPRDGDAELAQNADDLDTRAAEQEDLADQERLEREGAPAVTEARESTGPAAPPYDPAEREAVLKVMRERRDIRNGFRSNPIPHEVLLRVLEAAHHAPSVGHSQPWDFVVIRSADTRRAMHELAMRQRDAYAKSLPKGRAKQFKELKIEAILDTPVNIVVTADPTRGGRHTLGRHTQPQMAPYSAALAVENLWLAARAEGLGVGWVSFFDEREMVRALGLPEHLEVIAYLCVGYVDEFPDEPELLQAGWSKRRPLSWVVHEETYGRRALPGEEPHDLLAETVAQIRPLDAKALGEAWERQKRMTKPAGALGMLEIISAQLSGLSRQCPPPIPEPAAVAIFAGDHGVHAQGVTPWPQEVTAQMVANFLGGGAVCNAFATQVGAEVCIVDVGVAADLPATPGLLPRKIRGGTSDMTTGPAMTREEAKQAVEVGIETARDLVAAGNKALLTGEMGIGNTTASAALISVFTGADPAEVTGRGTGINDETLARKTEVVRRALELHQPDPADPIGVLAAIGGFEHAAIVGLLLGGASLRTPVILDGVSAGAAALVARAIAPEVLAACIAGHRSAEPGHVAALNKLGLRPLVDLDLRLGEGTGALLALPLVQSTARAMHEVATFDSAGVTEK